MNDSLVSQVQESIRGKRYFPPSAVQQILDLFDKSDRARSLLEINTLAHSVEGRPIIMASIGSGFSNILAWSQMHGNETTSTRAVLHYLAELVESSPAWLEEHTLHIILQLNPDGANEYTRENAAGVDLNRDAIQLSQPESRCLMDLITRLSPELCLNLHGQRTIYGLKDSELPCDFSFLAPAMDDQKTISSARRQAMRLIAAISRDPSFDSVGLGRYNDTYNGNCFGDFIMSQEIPVILFESGQSGTDYKRDKSLMKTIQALRLCVEKNCSRDFIGFDIADYEAIPEVSKNYTDLKVILQGEEVRFYRFRESVKNNSIAFIPELEESMVTHAHLNLRLSNLTTDEFHQVITKQIYSDPSRILRWNKMK
jgi:hypothetical protein